MEFELTGGCSVLCHTFDFFFFLPLPSFLLRFYSLLGATSHAQDVLPSAFLSSSYGANNAHATFLFWYLSPVPSVCDLLRFRICRATIHTRRMTATVVRKHIIVYLKLHRCICLAIFLFAYQRPVLSLASASSTVISLFVPRRKHSVFSL
ncbi:T. brucei spp.-specific protein [Trypanosoma brucei gambiense DAL972]|uniref:T. brucei spp.-specific protein n=1 Tax=Trypanosoma brucei gambiense (strain MHOM/CI/86/DAL972) TaxID=679716 RepID=C9ZNE0_TRYB9|nr:T. brucei spp.-specific protein [Trypanosoma brucei gambiense DAL972]CBH10918.1 T. brucei spp.-specific protein [Trypanosoma brucei gambiense DAL972]|eukprot:XP_011773205.1 T. brucei spp.-specific protein [Trypanosoma brucei gambiense DAL972]